MLGFDLGFFRLSNVSQVRPVVSVVCHTYNHREYIRQTLESFLGQRTNFPFEIIVHDDASTDGTSAIVSECAAQNPGMVLAVLQTQNQFSQGKRPSRFTFPRARGEYLAMCEGDDYWVDPLKLQKQVDAMRRTPQVNLCVHPAVQLNVASGKTRKAFYYGDCERVIGLDFVIARHNQFSPTASMLMRTEAAQSMPDWFFEEPGLPVGDAFIEAIVGCKGVLYMPDAMSVYRRGVPGSYTARFQRGGGEVIETSLDKMLKFTKLLASMPEIQSTALKQRLAYIRLNYALQCLAVGDRTRFVRISDGIDLPERKLLMAILRILKSQRWAFFTGRAVFLQLRRKLDR